jgi:hypothetical protein
VIRAAPVLGLVASPVRHWERLAALADPPQQVREADQVLGNPVDHLAVPLNPPPAGQQPSRQNHPPLRTIASRLTSNQVRQSLHSGAPLPVSII